MIIVLLQLRISHQILFQSEISHNSFVPNIHFSCPIILQAMMTSSNGNIFRVTSSGHLCREFTGPRWIPRTKASDAELWCFLWSNLRLNQRLSKQSWGLWFETLPRPLWCHRNELLTYTCELAWILTRICITSNTGHIFVADRYSNRSVAMQNKSPFPPGSHGGMLRPGGIRK